MASLPVSDDFTGTAEGVEGKVFDSLIQPTTVTEKEHHITESTINQDHLGSETDLKGAATASVKDAGSQDADDIDENAIIVTGADAARWLLPMRDDGDPALTFRSIFLATVLAGFQSTMNQIYQVCLYGFTTFLSSYADLCSSSNQVPSQSRALSSSSSPTSWDNCGLPSCPVVIFSRLNGARKATKELYLPGSDSGN